MRQLTQSEWQQLYCQWQITPPLHEMIYGSGEHYMLLNLLNRLGFNPRSREEVMEMADELVAMGYPQEEQVNVENVWLD